jgi:Lipase (class 3)
MPTQTTSISTGEKDSNSPSPAASAAYALCNWADAGAQGTPPASWTIIWQPNDPKVPGYAVILQNADISNNYAVVIQGTKDSQDWLWDKDCQYQAAFPYVANANISQGAQEALAGALGNTGAQGITFEIALRRISLLTNTFLFTGHSLGAFLAAILSAWFTSQLTGESTITELTSQITAITFAPPAMGDSNLASFLNNQANYTAYFNTNDAIPYVWAVTGEFSIPNMYNLFPSPGPSPMPPNIASQIENDVTEMQNNGVSYQQTNGVTFTVPPLEVRIGTPDTKWISELAYEHNEAYRDYFLGGE